MFEANVDLILIILVPGWRSSGGAFNPSTWGAEAGDLFEFQDSQGSMEKPFLENQKKKKNRKNSADHTTYF